MGKSNRIFSLRGVSGLSGGSGRGEGEEGRRVAAEAGLRASRKLKGLPTHTEAHTQRVTRCEWWAVGSFPQMEGQIFGASFHFRQSTKVLWGRRLLQFSRCLAVVATCTGHVTWRFSGGGQAASTTGAELLEQTDVDDELAAFYTSAADLTAILRTKSFTRSQFLHLLGIHFHPPASNPICDLFRQPIGRPLESITTSSTLSLPPPPTLPLQPPSQ